MPFGYLVDFDEQMEKAIELGEIPVYMADSIEELAQKYHASCHATHSPIEADWSIFEKEALSLEDVKSIMVHTSEMSLSAAFRTEATTGLEGKFSIPYCVANALLRGRGNTGLQAFTDEKVNDPKIKELMPKISTTQDSERTGMDARVVVETKNGEVYSDYADILNEVPELEVKITKIREKFTDLCEPILGSQKTQKIMGAISHMEEVKDMNALIDLL